MIDREEVARRHGLPRGFGDRLRGATAEEIEADAAATAALLRPEDPSEAPAGEILRALDEYRSKKARAYGPLVELLHPIVDPEEDA